MKRKGHATKKSNVWNQTGCTLLDFFAGNMIDIGFTASELEPSLYFCKKGSEFVVIWLHVDDSFAMSSSTKVLNELHEAISHRMEVKWTTFVDRLVGLGISSQGSLIKINQHLLVEQILSGYEGNGYPKRSTLPEDPLETNLGEMIKPTEY